MSAKAFLDTNIFVYAFDHSAPAKRDQAQEIIRDSRGWQVSWQVVQEFCAVALHRFATPMRMEDLLDYLELVLLPRCRVMPSSALYRQALAIHQQTHYQYYDSLIVASALVSGARVLYSEDLQHHRTIGALRIENPFRSSNP